MAARETGWKKVSVCVDFDGTITRRDSTNELLQRFADREWTVVEDEWVAGRITSAECMGRQVAMLRMTPAAYDDFARNVEIDPDFPAFLRLCEASGIPVKVVSDGLDQTIATVLSRAGLSVPFFANRLVWEVGERWRLEFPGKVDGCGAYCANCKCQFASTEPETFNVLIGDGRSDYCIAGNSDLVMAKGSLIEHCRQNGIRHVAIAGFADAIRHLSACLMQVAPAARAVAAS